MAFDDTKYLSSEDSAFPIGLGYVAAALEYAGHLVAVYDFQVRENTIDCFTNYLRKEQFDVIGFSVTSVTKNNTLRLADICRETLPGCSVIVGGAYTTIYPEDVIGNSTSIDFEVIGEGEITAVELLKALQEHSNFRQVPGIIFRGNNGELIKTERRPLVENVDDIVFPARHLFTLDAYTPPPGMFFKSPLRHMITTRGCPFSCVFCDDRVIWQGRCRMRSAENILAEMTELVQRYGAREIHFYDDTFTVSRQRVQKLCELLIESRLGVIWRCSSRVDTVSRDLLQMMYKAGCRSISYGIESGDDEILRKMRKGTTVAQARDAVKWTVEAGIQAKGFFMLNFPGDTIETTEKTIAMAQELDLDFAGFNLTMPHHGAELKKMVEDNYELNLEVYYDTEAKMGNEIYFHQPGLSAEYLKEAYTRAARGFYLRPAYILRMLTRIRNFDMFKSYYNGFCRLFRIGVK